MKPIRIGCVEYLNTLPHIEGLERWSGCELVMAVPSHLIDLLVADEIDIGLCSVVDSVASPAPVALLPVGMIGSDGKTRTVRLFSRVPIGEITTLHVDTDSHTSVALAQIILDRVHGIRPEVIPFDARHHGDWPETVLLIGDKVASDPPPPDVCPHTLDLGEAWSELTGLPFVYAVWMCRADEAASPAVVLGARMLDRQRLHNATRLGWISHEHAASHGWEIGEAESYLSSSLRYDVGSREMKAVDRFISEAARLGLVPARAVVWATGIGSVGGGAVAGA